MSTLSEFAPYSPLSRARRAHRGFSLTESLVTLLIVTLLTAAIARGVSFAQQQYVNALITSESKVLYSTLETALRHELSYTTGIKAIGSGSGEVVKFVGVNYSDKGGSAGDTYFYVAVIDAASNAEASRGVLALMRDGVTPKKLIADRAYTHGLTASAKLSTVTVHGIEYVRVELNIYHEDGRQLISEPFHVEPLNTEIVHESAGS